MKLLRTGALIVAGIFSLLPTPAKAYHFVGSTPNGCRWPEQNTADFSVDGSSSAALHDVLLAEVIAARDAWNGVGTARDVFGAFTLDSVNYDETNFGIRWGIGAASEGPPSDGRNEIVLDETGNILRLLGLDPAVVNGYSSYRLEVVGGTCSITDAFYVVNGTRGDFDRISNAVHELGHILGLAHSSVGQANSYNNTASSGAASSSPSSTPRVLDIQNVPAMHPYADGTGTARRTLKADDIAGLSELYPQPGVPDGFGAITGTVRRCTTNTPLAGINVRAVNRNHPAIQISRYTAFDGNDQGRYEIRGIPPGTYDVVVEQMGQNGFTAGAMAIQGRVDGDFPAELVGPSSGEEAGCTEAMPDSALPIDVVAGTTIADVNARVLTVDIAWVVDDTGSMSNEIASVRDTLSSFVDRIARPGRPFPTIAIVSFKDDVTIRRISNSPNELRAIINSLVASGGADCPESSAAAILDANRLVRTGGTVVLFTDADSRNDGPDRTAMIQAMTSKSVTFNPILSATCGEAFSGSSVLSAFEALGGAVESRSSGPTNDELHTPPALGFENGATTFSQVAFETHGVFLATERPRSAEARARYVNIATNIAVSAVMPAVGLVGPLAAPQGAALTLEVTGLNTNWQPGSTVHFPGTTIAVGAVVVASATQLYAEVTIPAAEPLGFVTIEVDTFTGPGDPEIAEGVGSFQIRPAVGEALVSVSPSRATADSTVELTLRTMNTNLTAGTIALQILQNNSAIDPDIAVVSLNVLDATKVSAVLNISAPARAGVRHVRLVLNNSRVLTLVRSLFINGPPAPLPRLVEVAPGQGTRGQNGINVTVHGEHTHFADGASTLSFGEGITVVDTAITSPGELTAMLDIAGSAAPGFRDVRVTTGDEHAVLIDGFNLLCRAAPVEACNNGADDDSNGLLDCADPACAAETPCQPRTWCSAGACNDGNVCTAESCGAGGSCVHTPANAGGSCGDGAGVCNHAGECETPAATVSCALEGVVHSRPPAFAIPIDFRNHRREAVHVYRLDESGARQELCASPFAAGASHREAAYNGAYYLVTDTAGVCLGIYKTSAQLSAVDL